MSSGRIAVIGWGSLLWDLERLTPRVEGPWRMRAGPRLPMEFSRVSAKRLEALAVCLDAEAGEPCATHVIVSRRRAVWRAAIDLALRERASLRRIGAFDRLTGRRWTRMPEIAEAVAAWCEAEDWQGAVWTDLEPNFADRLGAAFSVERGVAYLRTLRGPSLDEAVRYIENAPAETDTPLRRRLSDDPWWQGEAARLRRTGAPGTILPPDPAPPPDRPG